MKRFRVVGRISRPGDGGSAAAMCEFITAKSSAEAIVQAALRTPHWELISCEEDMERPRLYVVPGGKP